MRSAVDFHSRYTRVKDRPSDAFPEQTELWSPIVQIILRHDKKHFGAFGLLDTGSNWTIIGSKYADPLGMDWRRAPSMTFAGIGNAKNVGYAMDVKLVLVPCNYAWDARVVVSEAADPFPMILLGHLGFFDHFDATFQTRLQHFHVHRK